MTDIGAYKGDPSGFNPWLYRSPEERLAAERAMLQQGGFNAYRGMDPRDPRHPYYAPRDDVQHQQEAYERYLTDKAEQLGAAGYPNVGAAAATGLELMGGGPGDAFPFMPGGLGAVYGKKMRDLIDPKFREGYDQGSRAAEKTLMEGNPYEKMAPYDPLAEMKEFEFRGGGLDPWDVVTGERIDPKVGHLPKRYYGDEGDPLAGIMDPGYPKTKYDPVEEEKLKKLQGMRNNRVEKVKEFLKERPLLNKKSDSGYSSYDLANVFDEIYDANEKIKPDFIYSSLPYSRYQSSKINLAVWNELKEDDRYRDIYKKLAKAFILTNKSSHRHVSVKDFDKWNANDTLHEISQIAGELDTNKHGNQADYAKILKNSIYKELKDKHPDIDVSTADEMATRMSWEFEDIWHVRDDVKKRIKDKGIDAKSFDEIFDIIWNETRDITKDDWEF